MGWSLFEILPFRDVEAVKGWRDESKLMQQKKMREKMANGGILGEWQKIMHPLQSLRNCGFFVDDLLVQVSFDSLPFD